MAVFQYIGVYHTTAQNLYPTGMFTNSASFPATNKTTYIHFGAGFGKREIRRTKADTGIATKHFSYKEIKGLFKIGKRNPIVYVKSFYLVVQTVFPGITSFVFIFPARTNNANGQLALLHYAYLYRGSMRTHHCIGVLV